MKTGKSALIAKLDARGTPFSVGANQELTATESAVLYFRVNDPPKWVFDNSGEMDVTVRLLQEAAPGRA